MSSSLDASATGSGRRICGLVVEAYGKVSVRLQPATCHRGVFGRPVLGSDRPFMDRKRLPAQTRYKNSLLEKVRDKQTVVQRLRRFEPPCGSA